MEDEANGTVRAEGDGSSGVAGPESIAELREVLGELRDEIRSRFPVPTEARSPAAPSDLEALLAAARRRLGTLGMSEQSAEIDEFGMDLDAVRRSRPRLDFLCDRYWRLRLGGREHVPEVGPCLLVANRSGVMPFDGLVLAHAIERAHPRRERPRFLVADGVMGLPFARAALARLGAVRACRENAERLLAARRLVIAFPEGDKGAAKVFRERYRLQRFGRGGVVRLALAHRAPLVPVGVVGAEEVHPLLAKFGVPARTLGLPFLPLTPTFPFLGPLGVLPLPSQWVIRIGAPISLAQHPPEAAADELLVARLTEELRARVRELVEAGLRDRDSIWSFR